MLNLDLNFSFHYFLVKIFEIDTDNISGKKIMETTTIIIIITVSVLTSIYI